MSAHAQSASSGTAPTTLASAALPARVRHILEAVNALAAQSLSTSLNLALNEFERQLFKQADRARSSQHQAEHFSELQHLRQHRADLVLAAAVRSSNTRGSISGAMPTPVSMTETTTSFPSHSAVRRMRPPDSVNFDALFRRLPKIWLSLTGSPSTNTGSRGIA